MTPAEIALSYFQSVCSTHGYTVENRAPSLWYATETDGLSNIATAALDVSDPYRPIVSLLYCDVDMPVWKRLAFSTNIDAALDPENVWVAGQGAAPTAPPAARVIQLRRS